MGPCLVSDITAWGFACGVQRQILTTYMPDTWPRGVCGPSPLAVVLNLRDWDPLGTISQILMLIFYLTLSLPISKAIEDG